MPPRRPLLCLLLSCPEEPAAGALFCVPPRLSLLPTPFAPPAACCRTRVLPLQRSPAHSVERRSGGTVISSTTTPQPRFASRHAVGLLRRFHCRCSADSVRVAGTAPARGTVVGGAASVGGPISVLLPGCHLVRLLLLNRSQRLLQALQLLGVQGRQAAPWRRRLGGRSVRGSGAAALGGARVLLRGGPWGALQSRRAGQVWMSLGRRRQAPH